MNKIEEDQGVKKQSTTTVSTTTISRSFYVWNHNYGHVYPYFPSKHNKIAVIL